MGYQPVNVRQSYTGYLKDEESGLEFAEARYYNPLHGRFTSVDPLTASATVRNPQTFNRYAYALNSPYKFIDPPGLVPTSLDTRFGGDSGFCSASNASCEEGEDITTESIQAYQKKQQEKEKKRQEERQKKREENRRKRQEPKKPAPPLIPTTPKQSRVEPNSSDANIAGQNEALANVFTDGNGIVRTTRTDPETFFGDGPSHFRFSDGQIWAIHVYGDESGNTAGNVFVPKGFNARYIGGNDSTVVAFNPNTGELIYFHHIAGVSSQRELERNMKSKNNAGSRLIGQTGGKNGNGPGYLHACIKIFNGYQGRNNYIKSISGRAPVNQGDYRDFRRFIK